MATITIDTLKLSDKLVSAGFDPGASRGCGESYC